MTPEFLLRHHDSGALWPYAPGDVGGADIKAAYQQALAVRALRCARGERPAGYKIGFTNRTIWSRYNVYAPIWGTVWASGLVRCSGSGELNLAGTCQPRLEPELVFGLRATPKANASLQDLLDAIDWVAPGFELVQSHLPDWKFTAPDTVADGALHARLLVGRPIAAETIADDADAFDRALAVAQVELHKGAQPVEQGQGANVLDSPLRALHHFLLELRACPGAGDLQPGDVVTTGTWTDAWPVAPGETWSAHFSAPLGELTVHFR